MIKKHFCSFTDSKVLSCIEFEQFYLFIVCLFLHSKLFIICWFQTALLLKFLIWGPINETEFSRAIIYGGDCHCFAQLETSLTVDS